MSKPLTVADYEHLRDLSLNKLKAYMGSLPTKKGAKLAYWISDYVRFLEKENCFDSRKLIRYKRGSVVKVHLGYRIGSEEGGLHYAVILDVNNALSNPTATIIPLTSVKPGTDLHHMHFSRVYLGDEIYNLLINKCRSHVSAAINRVNELGSKMAEINSTPIVPDAPDAIKLLAEKEEKESAIQAERAELSQEVNYCQKMLDEIDKMKRGSIALVGQVTTISKIRIYDPLYPRDILSDIRLSAESMNKLDAKIKELFTYKNEK